MEHVLLKAVTTQTTDAGLFTAVISTAAVDRENDVVVPEAMVDALKAWTFTGKMIPLHWNHSAEPEDIIGHVNPATVKAVDGEVLAEGWIDQDTERGRHAWRIAKSGTLGFSFGYLIPDGGAVKRADGVREIHKLDVFEVSATPTPINNGTRVLSTKGLEDDDPDRVPTEAELERRMIELGLITEPATAEQYRRADPVLTGQGPNGNAETKAIRDQWRDDMVQLLTASTGEYQTKAEKSLPATTAEPIKVASFEC